MGLPNRENQILQDAIDALQEIVDLKAKVLPLPKTQARLQADALIEVHFNAHKQLFVAEIKTIDRRIAVGQIKAQLQNLIDQQYGGYHPLLVTGFATPDLAEECRKLDLPFVDKQATSTYTPKIF
jgi:hypothetical protein